MLLWPPDYDDEIWTVKIKNGDKEMDLETTDRTIAEECAFAVARVLGVIAGYPTKDGEIRDLQGHA